LLSSASLGTSQINLQIKIELSKQRTTTCLILYLVAFFRADSLMSLKIQNIYSRTRPFIKEIAE
jgi:hypothetical protein